VGPSSSWWQVALKVGLPLPKPDARRRLIVTQIDKQSGPPASSVHGDPYLEPLTRLCRHGTGYSPSSASQREVYAPHPRSTNQRIGALAIFRETPGQHVVNRDRSVLIWTRHSPQSTFMEIRWSKFSLEGEKAPSPLGLFILREIMSGAASFVRIRDTRRGAVASFYVNIRFSAESHTWTSAYRTVSSYVKCPSITSGLSEERTPRP
jgi:hypothetical protein